MIIIEVNNNKCRLSGKLKTLVKIQKAFKVKNPNAFWIRQKGNVQEGWDGMINYISESFYFKTGLLPKVYKYINENYKDKIELIDNRPNFNINPRIPKKIGVQIPRKIQIDAVKSIVENEITNGIPYWFGVIDAATNAGKTGMMAMIYLAFKKKIPTLMLLKDGDLYEQFKRELPELIGENELGCVRGAKEQNWGNFTIAMVQTLARDINKYKRHLLKFGIVLVDEADEANSTSYKKILQNCYNSNVRVGLSGSIYKGKLAKDKIKNENIRCFFSDVTFKITKMGLYKLGYSTPVIINIIKGNIKPGIKGDFQEEYRQNITLNKDRAKIGLQRLKFHIKIKRLPALIICRYHEHIETLYNIYNEALGNKYRVEFVHGGIHRKIRKELLEDFRIGKVDILISSFIIKRGKNHPLIRYIQNAAGSDSQETIIQIMGRGERTHKSKKRYYLDDFFDDGFYLKRHSKHRVNYYVEEGFKINKKY